VRSSHNSVIGEIHRKVRLFAQSGGYQTSRMHIKDLAQSYLRKAVLALSMAGIMH